MMGGRAGCVGPRMVLGGLRDVVFYESCVADWEVD
jgi:hypothetical protein